MSLASDRLYTERSILKYALEMARLGFVVMLNYQSLASFFMSLVNGFKDGHASAPVVHTYDSWVGPSKYILGVGIVVVSVSSLMSVTLTLVRRRVLDFALLSSKLTIYFKTRCPRSHPGR